jgi:adenine-specific DNA-methyltransferase
MNKLKMQTPNLVDKNVEQIAGLFPEVITEIKDKEGNIIKGIDFDLLKQKLSHVLVEGENERYRLDWPGKKASLLKANTPITKTLRPVVEDSVNFDKTENLYIEGDNFEVLKILQESYLGKVKMIYIDPPYNTGNDFIYRDAFKKSTNEYKEEINAIDEEGGKLFKNTDSNGRFHSDWLTMLYERLLIARDLLADDGIILVSIGVEELKNLKAILDETFGEENFVEIFSWVKTSTPPALSTKSRKTNEYILCYEKYKNSQKYNGELLDGGDQPLLNSGNSVVALKFPKESVYFRKDKFPNGKLAAGLYDRVTLSEDIIIHDGYSKSDFILEGEFKWTQDFLNAEIQKGTKFLIKSEKLSIRFIRDEEGYKRPTNYIKEKYTSPLINKKENGVGTNENASSELIELLGGYYFDYPKPVSLIKYLINFVCKQNDIVLDFFAGSATTAEAVYQFNIENHSKLKYILVQLQEELDEKKARDANEKKRILASIKFLNSLGKPTNVSEIGKERIRRAGRRIKDEYLKEREIELTKINRELKYKTLAGSEELREKKSELELKIEHIKNLDIGFRVYKTDSSNMKDAFYHPMDITQEQLSAFESNIKEDRTPEDLLTQVMLDLGLELSLSIDKREILGNSVLVVQENALVACFDDNINFSIVNVIADMKPSKMVFKDACFAYDKDKINVEKRFKRLSPETVIMVI